MSERMQPQIPHMTRPRKLRILYVIDSLVAGGIESQMVDLIANLDRERFDPHVLVFYGAPLRPPHYLDALRALQAPLYLLDLGPGASDKLLATSAIIRSAWSLRPQIIQAENYHANLLTRAARPFLPPATRLIGTHHGVYTAHQMRYERLEHRMCTVIVASAEHLRQQLIVDAGAPADRIVVIPNSIDVARFGGAAARGAALRARLASHARRLLVSVGRISHEKRMDLFIAALGLLKREGVSLAEVRVAIIGPTEEAEAQRRLDEALARDALTEIVTCIPRVSDPEAYFAACDVSVLASPEEGLPIVALESLAAGKPVLLSERANAAGVIAAGATGWVAATNAPADLAVALRQVLAASDDELRTMGERCRAEAARYSVTALARRYMGLYVALAAPGGLGAGAKRAAALAEATC